MARKNLLDGLGALPDGQAAPVSYPMRGAGKSLVRSLDDLAKQADRFLDGEVIVELDPEEIDDSFVQDRLARDNEDFHKLVETIRERGQDTPILVRPHSSIDGRYQVVFGHRRVRAARELGRKVKAVVKRLDDLSHVIAQGQENSARANLTFIERALFAKRLLDLGYDREVAGAALASNAASLSKMLAVTERVPARVIEAIGEAPGIGRERWLELSLLLGKQANGDKIADLLEESAFLALSSDERFLHVYKTLKASGRPTRKHRGPADAEKWETSDRALVADIKKAGKTYSISLKSKNAKSFGDFLSRNLPALYDQFLIESKGEQ